MALGITDQNEIDERVRTISNLRKECTNRYVKAHEIVFETDATLKLRRSRVVDEEPDEDGYSYNYVDLIELKIESVLEFDQVVGRGLEGKTYLEVVKDFIMGYVNYKKEDLSLGEKYSYISQLLPLPVKVEFMVENLVDEGRNKTLLLGVEPREYKISSENTLEADVGYSIGGINVEHTGQIDDLTGVYVVNIEVIGL